MNASRTIPLAALLLVAGLTYFLRQGTHTTVQPPPPTSIAPPPPKPASPFVLRHGEKHYAGARCPACEYKEIVF